MKAKNALSFLTLLTVILFAGCKKDTFTEEIGLCPAVVLTNPENEVTSVPLTQIITATFNKEMNSTTITQESFTIQGPASAISGIVSYSGTTASFTPSVPLSINTTYTGRIKTLARDLKGNALQEDYVWTFSTGQVITPMVILTDPENNDTNVVLNKVITATFSVAMDQSTINGTTFTLMLGATAISGVVGYNGVMATFTPSVNLSPDTVYTATITTGAKNLSGTPIASNYVWNFTTELIVPVPKVISTDPDRNETNVALNKVISATFSEQMDLLTINGSTFTLMKGLTAIAGSVNYSGVTATFTPTNNLESDTVYTATITTGAKSVDGAPLASDYVWKFSTVAHLGPNGIDLDCVAGYAIIGGSTVSNTGATVVDGDLGLSPGSSVTGFPPGVVINGAIKINDTETNNAKVCLTTAYNDAAGRSLNVIIVADGELGGKTFAPGLYQSGISSFAVTSSDFTLDAQGDENAVWIFQMPSSTLTIGNGMKVTLTNGAQAKNIYWQVGSSATIGTTAEMKGNIMADQSITLQTNAVLLGRALCRIAAITLDDNDVTKP